MKTETVKLKDITSKKKLKEFKQSLNFYIDLHVENLKSAIEKIDVVLQDFILFSDVNDVTELFKKIPKIHLEFKKKIDSLKIKAKKNKLTDYDLDAEQTQMASFLLIKLMHNRGLIVDLLQNNQYWETDYFKIVVESRAAEVLGLNFKKTI